MNRYLTGLIALILVATGGIYFLATRSPSSDESALHRPAKPESTSTSFVVAAEPSTPPTVASPQTEALLQAPDESQTMAPASASQIPEPAPTTTDKASPYARIVIPKGQPVPELFPFQTERDKISELASSYDVKKIPAIAAYLKHTDASVREAARQGLIQLGEEKAAPVLKEAATKAPTPEEATLLTEAAEFLALPNFVDIVLPADRTPSS